MNKKLLVIDDEQIVLDSVKRILSKESYNLTLTTKSREGLKLALSEDFDLILTDIKMPEIGGMRVLRDIKREKPETPVVILTGYATVQSAVGAMKLGASDYLEKPFLPDVLLRTIEKVISKASNNDPEPQEMLHHEEILKILDRTDKDNDFVANLFYYGSEALEEYNLTSAERLAILTGDIKWLEKNIGELKPAHKRWLEQRLSAEIW
ncbi:MAG: response regulator [Spirochaetaceae bacterium]|nr:response regulator [Spirochaetaceae bacterium]